MSTQWSKRHRPSNLPLLTMDPLEQTRICVLSNVKTAAVVGSFLDVGTPYKGHTNDAHHPLTYTK